MSNGIPDPLPPYNSVVSWVGNIPAEFRTYLSPGGIAVADPGPDFAVAIPRKPDRVPQTRQGGLLGAWNWSCTEWDEMGQEEITMLINPENAQWTVPFRISRVNTFGGTIFHRWQNMNRSPADLPTIRLRMNTGNIFPTSALASLTVEGQTVRFKSIGEEERKNVFFRLCSLAHQRAFTRNGNPNIVTITYKSVLFGQVSLYVVFTEPITFVEDALKPFNVQYDVGLTVLGQNPEFTSPESFQSSMVAAASAPAG